VKPEKSASKSRLHETEKSKPKGYNKETGFKNTSKDSKGKSLSSIKNPSKVRKTS
jgi:hypothetical protein